MDLVLVAINADSHPLLDIGGRHALAESNHKLGDLFHVDHVLVLALGAARAKSRTSECAEHVVQPAATTGAAAARRAGVRAALSVSVLLLAADNLCAARDLQRLLFAHALLVRSNVPQVQRSKTSVTLLDTHLLVDPLFHLTDLVVDLFQRRRIGTLPIRLEQLDIALIKRHDLVVVLVRIGIRLRVLLPVFLRRHVHDRRHTAIRAAAARRQVCT